MSPPGEQSVRNKALPPARFAQINKCESLNKEAQSWSQHIYPHKRLLEAAHCFCREAITDEELWACSRLRAQCFYAYPPEREFAGKVRILLHFHMILQVMPRATST